MYEDNSCKFRLQTGQIYLCILVALHAYKVASQANEAGNMFAKTIILERSV